MTKRNWITINANYELVIDNLLDQRHSPDPHDGLLGNEDTIDSKISVEQEGDTVISGRWPTESVNGADPGEDFRDAPLMPSRSPVIEAQQIAIDQAGEGLDPLLLSIDVGPAR